MRSGELDIGAHVAIRNLSEQLVPVLSESLAHIRNALLHYVNQKRGDLVEEAVFHVVVPGADENAVVWLYYEVVANVVDDDCLVHGTTQQRQVLHKEGPVLTGVLPVESVFDVLAHVDLVNDLVSVLLHRRSEDHDLVVLGHRLNELDAARPHKEIAFISVLKTRLF